MHSVASASASLLFVAFNYRFAYVVVQHSATALKSHTWEWRQEGASIYQSPSPSTYVLFFVPSLASDGLPSSLECRSIVNNCSSVDMDF
ncbi:hypothetical protein BGZ63DRAFT_374498, partial [Mariannaea sp. PMI_226]